MIYLSKMRESCWARASDWPIDLTLEQAIEAVRLGADYIGVGAIYPTLTKPDKTARGRTAEICKS